MNSRYGFYEFFCGGGMARLGLGPAWQCLLANDNSPKKVRTYRVNFPPADELIFSDIHDLSSCDIPDGGHLAWASFPCQDLSLAGNGRGLRGQRSGSYWGFWRLLQSLQNENRAVPLVVLENVAGTITANQGTDFSVLLNSLYELGYRVGPLIVDAVDFLPQSRPRLFIIAVLQNQVIPTQLLLPGPDMKWHSRRIIQAFHQMSEEVRHNWIWWNLPHPPVRSSTLTELIMETPPDVEWHTLSETQSLLELMNERHLRKVQAAQESEGRIVGTFYRRIRRDAEGRKSQRAEIRFDQVSGCLRTGSGGSSKQFIMEVHGKRIRSRLLSAREAARLMGIPEDYVLPEAYGEAYHLVGDGLAVPVVSWIEKHILSRLLQDDAANDIGNANTCPEQIEYIPSQQPLGLLKES